MLAAETPGQYTTASQPTVFDTVIVVTDRRVLDKQIRDTIRQFAQVGSVVGHAERGEDLRRFLEAGKKLIITTVQKFPVIVDKIGADHRENKFALIIDEAHSGQGGSTMAKMQSALSEDAPDTEETPDERIARIMESRKLLPNASYFAFKATPKGKTLQLFGIKTPKGGYRPFHVYTGLRGTSLIPSWMHALQPITLNSTKTVTYRGKMLIESDVSLQRRFLQRYPQTKRIRTHGRTLTNLLQSWNTTELLRVS